MSPQWTSAGSLVVVEAELDVADFLRELLRHHTRHLDIPPPSNARITLGRAVRRAVIRQKAPVRNARLVTWRVIKLPEGQEQAARRSPGAVAGVARTC